MGASEVTFGGIARAVDVLVRLKTSWRFKQFPSHCSLSIRNYTGRSGIRLPNTGIPDSGGTADYSYRSGIGRVTHSPLEDCGETQDRTHLQPLLCMAISEVPVQWGPHPQELP